MTGASSGIGTAFAKWYAENDCDVILVARDAAALGEVAESVRRGGGTAEVIVADLSHREGVELVSGQCGVVDVLVCNAGLPMPLRLGHRTATISIHLPISCRRAWFDCVRP